MKKLILMAIPALFALAGNAQQKEEVKKAPPKLVKVEKAEEVKAPPQKGKFKGKTAPKIVKQKFSGPPPPPPPKIERKKFTTPPPPPPAEKRPSKKDRD